MAIRLNQTAIEAVTPITSFEKRPEGSPNPDRYLQNHRGQRITTVSSVCEC